MPLKVICGRVFSVLVLCAGLLAGTRALQAAEKGSLDKPAAKGAIELAGTLEAANVGFARLEGTSLFLTRGLENAAAKGTPQGGQSPEGQAKGGFWFDLKPDPRSPVLVCDSLPAAWDVAISGKHAFVCDYTRYLSVYEVGEHAWELVTKLEMPSMTENILIRGNLAYVANHSAGLTIVDIATPGRPSIVSNFNPRIDCDALGLWKDCAVLYAHWESRLVLVDISDPTKPRQTAVFQYEGKFNQGEIAVEDGVAYCTSADGLVVVDVAGKASPRLLSVVKDIGGTNDVAVKDGYAFVSAGKGICVVDVSNAASPAMVASYPGGWRELAVLRTVPADNPRSGDEGVEAHGPGSDYLVYATGPKVSVLVFHAPARTTK